MSLRKNTYWNADFVVKMAVNIARMVTKLKKTLFRMIKEETFRRNLVFGIVFSITKT